jgi:CHAT domain-containing protein/tetratricopeptide (TPR) repeat protein
VTQSAAWQKEMNRLREAGQLKEALAVAERLKELRSRKQKDDHWEAVDARWQVEALQRVLAGGKEAAISYAAIAPMMAKANELEKQNRHVEASPIREQVLGLYRKLLGENHPYTATSYHWQAYDQNALGKYTEAELLVRKGIELRLKLLGENHPDTASSYNDLAMSQGAQGKYAEAEANLRKVLELRVKLLGKNHSDTATSYGNLAGNQYAQGKYAEAEAGYLKAFEVRVKFLDENHSDTAGNYNNLAISQYFQGKYAEAEAGYRKALDLRIKFLGENHSDTASSYNNLAVSQYLQGKYVEAEVGYRKALDLRLKLLGENHRRTALSFNNLANNQHLQEKYAEAEAGFRKAHELRRKLLGENHQDTVASYNNLVRSSAYAAGKATSLPPWQRYLLGYDVTQSAAWQKEMNRLREAGQLKEALAVAERLKELRSRKQKDDHWEAVDARWQVEALQRVLAGGKEAVKTYAGIAATLAKANALEQLGRYREASPIREQLLALYRKLLDEDHPYTANSYYSLASNQYSQERYAEAERGYHKALKLCLRLLGENHPDTASGYRDLAMSQGAQGKYAEGEANLRKALDLRRRLSGENNADTVSNYRELAYLQRAQGKYAEAELNFQTVLDLHLKLLGDNNAESAQSYNDLAANQRVQGKYVAAETNYRKALDLRLKLLGENHPRTAQSYNNLAVNQNAQGKYGEAEANLRKALDLFRKIWGENHPDTAFGYGNLGHNQNEQRKYLEAEPNLRKALNLRLKLLGENHTDTASSYSRLASNQSAQGNYVVAEAHYRKALDLYLKLLGENHPLTAQSYSDLAAFRDDQGRFAEAESLFIRAANSFDQARLHAAATGLERAVATGDRSPLVHLAAVLACNGKPDTAWQRYEQGLGRGTWDDLATRRRYTSAERAKQAELEARVQRINQLLQAPAAVAGTPGTEERRAQLLTQRLKAQGELRAFTKALEQTYGPVAGQVFDLLSIQAALASDAALVGWIDIDTPRRPKDPNGEHWAFLLRSTGVPVCERLVGTGPEQAWTKDDSQLATKLRDVLPSPSGNWQPLAQKMRSQRFDPLQKHLDGIKRLIVLPSSAMAGVPVEILADGRAVSYALSGTMFAYLRNQPRPESRALLALADPVFEPGLFPKPDPLLAAARGDDTWAPLPGTRAEAETLRRLATEPAPLVLTGSNASEQRLHELAASGELARFRYLHLATHGIADNRLPLHSAIILSRDKLPDPEKQMLAGQPIFDGRLTAREVLQNWELNAELVTLSACQTALGKYEGGEGFLGFAQALTIAGSRAVCLSLWKVDDTATALLMERFYQNLLGKRPQLVKPLGKAAALAEAKAWLRDLPRAQAVRRNDLLAQAVNRGKDRPVQPLLPAVPEPSPTVTAKSDRPYAHPYYWAAFILIGDPD